MPSYKSVFLLLVFQIICVNSFNLQEGRVKHEAKSLSNDEFSSLAALSNMTHFQQIFDKILIPRVVGSPGHKTVRSVIKSSMEAENWEITSDIFTASTPIFGTLQFENIIATLNPKAKRFLVLACHYDSKYFAENDFLGATDSAVPCAMMINLAHTMKEVLSSKDHTDISLKLIFFDGEEAFVEWSDSDSLYGSRNLAAKWEKTPISGNSNLLHTIDLLVLLDLLGAPNPVFYCYFKNTEHWHHLMNQVEKSLSELGHLEIYTTGRDDKMYFRSEFNNRGIQDDHIPFLKRGVPILHVITNPFPDVWHTPKDNRDAIDLATISNLLKIFRAFIASYLHL